MASDFSKWSERELIFNISEIFAEANSEVLVGIGVFGNLHTGAAWLSSARVVRCWVKSRNERNPFPYLPAG